MLVTYIIYPVLFVIKNILKLFYFKIWIFIFVKKYYRQNTEKKYILLTILMSIEVSIYKSPVPMHVFWHKFWDYVIIKNITDTFSLVDFKQIVNFVLAQMN